MAAPSKGARRLSLIAGLAAGEAYSIYATFYGHALRSPSLYVADQHTDRHLLTGQIGYIVEVFYWDDLIRLVAISLLIFALVSGGAWLAVKFLCETPSAVAHEIDSRSPSPRIGDPIVGFLAPRDVLRWVTGFEVESRPYTTAAEGQVLDGIDLPQTKLKEPILLEAAWEVTDASSDVMAMVDAENHRMHTATIQASSLKTEHSRATRRHHHSRT